MFSESLSCFRNRSFISSRPLLARKSICGLPGALRPQTETETAREREREREQKVRFCSCPHPKLPRTPPPPPNPDREDTASAGLEKQFCALRCFPVDIRSTEKDAALPQLWSLDVACHSFHVCGAQPAGRAFRGAPFRGAPVLAMLCRSALARGLPTASFSSRAGLQRTREEGIRR